MVKKELRSRQKHNRTKHQKRDNPKLRKKANSTSPILEENHTNKDSYLVLEQGPAKMRAASLRVLKIKKNSKKENEDIEDEYP